MFTLKIKTDNAAFEDPGIEIARILKVWAHKIEEEIDPGRYNIHDLNGNKVGYIDWN